MLNNRQIDVFVYIKEELIQDKRSKRIVSLSETYAGIFVPDHFNLAFLGWEKF